MMIWFLPLMILGCVNGETIIKRDGMMYQQMSSNSSWESAELNNSQSFDSSENPFIELDYTSNSQCQCGWINPSRRKYKTRIVGGDFYTAHKYPFIAGVAQRAPQGWQPFCGGSILTPNHVLTAAHCISDLSGLRTQLAVLLGTYDMRKPDRTAEAIPVTSYTQHEEFNTATLQNDIAILALSQSITYTPSIGPVCMPQPSLDVTGQSVKIIGWGAQKYNGPMSTTPKEMNTVVIPTARCSSAWPGIVSPVRPTQLCTYSKNASPCKGDSGGPVVWLNSQTQRFTLVGIVSFGPQCTETRPSVQTKVVSYLPWIYQKIHANKPANTC